MNASLPIADRGARQLSSSAKLGSAVPAAHRKRHSALVRVTHWITTVAFLALLVSGAEIVQGKTVLGTGTLSGGTATYTTTTLKVGTSSITAVYGGDANFAASKSKPVKQVVEKAGE